MGSSAFCVNGTTDFSLFTQAGLVEPSARRHTPALCPVRTTASACERLDGADRWLSFYMSGCFIFLYQECNCIALNHFAEVFVTRATFSQGEYKSHVDGAAAKLSQSHEPSIAH